jgi:hypothetical protein
LRRKSAEFYPQQHCEKNFPAPLQKENCPHPHTKTRKRFEINTSTMGSHSSRTMAQDFAVSLRFLLDIFSTHDDTRTPDSTLCFESVGGPFGVLGVSEAWSDKPIKYSGQFLQDKNREWLWISRHGGAFAFGAAAAFFQE